VVGYVEARPDFFKELVEQYPGTPWAERSPVKPGARATP
jgi:hypothetical protein